MHVRGINFKSLRKYDLKILDTYFFPSQRLSVLYIYEQLNKFKAVINSESMEALKLHNKV